MSGLPIEIQSDGRQLNENGEIAGEFPMAMGGCYWAKEENLAAALRYKGEGNRLHPK
jgi:hypothetical protein